MRDDPRPDGRRRRFALPRSAGRAARDAAVELQSLVDERIDHLRASGLSDADARREALRRLGAPLAEATAQLRHTTSARTRRMQLRTYLADLARDVSYAVRTLRRDLRFTLFATLIVALGIGATVTVFSVASALLVRPLPFAEPDRLVWIDNDGHGDGLSGHTVQVSWVQDVAERATTLDGIGGYFAFYSPGDAQLGAGGATIRLSAVPVTQNFLPLLGVRPRLGRNFTPAEAVVNGPRVVLLSHTLWATRYEADPAIVGRGIVLDGQTATVVGVLPPSFEFGSIFAPGTRVDLLTPFPLAPETDSQGNTLSLVGRLKPGVPVARAQAELAGLARRLTGDVRRRNDFAPLLAPLGEHVSGGATGALVLLAGATALVMLIVCANIANLLLARSTTRRKELAIRAALGAGRARLVRQTLTESVVLAAMGAALGIALAVAATRAIAGAETLALPLIDRVHVDGAALAFATLLALLAGLGVGLIPALQLRDARVHDALKASSRSATDGRGGRALRDALVVAEIALACVLLVGSGLLGRSLQRVLATDLGFRPEGVASLRVDPTSDAARQTTAGMSAYMDQVLGRVAAIPGVRSAALTDRLPLDGDRSWVVRERGRTARADSHASFVRVVSEGYVPTLGMRIVAGRDLTADDGPTGEPVALVNESLARALWPDGGAVGRYVVAAGERRVVGVVADARQITPEAPSGAEVFLPLRQTSDWSAVHLAVRSTLAPAALATSLRAALAPVIPDLATNMLRPLGAIVDRAVSSRRFVTLLVGAFAAFALLLALLGIYAVVSYTVANRTQEIGVRLALGASAGRVQRRIVADTLRLAAAGIVLGAAGAWLLARLLGGLLYGVSASDPATFGGMVLVLAAVAAASGWVPARRASRVSPVTAMRGE